MIDIHSHILPMIDDGASSVEMALEMLVKAYDDGTDEIILTPHFAKVYGFDNPKSKIIDLFDDLVHIVKYEKIPIDLYLGCEYLFESKERFFEDKKEITTINNTNYLLMEFFFDVEGNTILEAVDTVLESGWIPILAHPERYDCVQNELDIAYEAKKRGALLQMNKGSILGRYGNTVKETSYDLLNEHVYSFVGSDAHHPRYRSSLMYEAYEKVKELFGKTYANKIFKGNAKELLKIRKEREHEEY